MMTNKNRELFDRISAGVKLAVKNELEKIKNSADPVIAISKNGKHIEFINLRDKDTK